MACSSGACKTPYGARLGPVPLPARALKARAAARESQLAADLAWPRERLDEVLLALKRNGLVELAGPALRPTPMGLGFLSATAG